MRFYRDKARLLALMAFLAPLPLPLNDVVEWLPVAAFCGAVALFLYRTENGITATLPNWVMNVLGVAYLPFLFADLTVLRQGRFLQPLVHLTLYVMAVKLFALRQEKDKWHLFLGLFFLFLASMGTSVHPSVVLYLLIFVALATLTLVRFSGLHAASIRQVPDARSDVPVMSFVAGAILLSILAAVPLFFFLPRLKQPYVYVPTGAFGGAAQITGFADRLDLGTVDRARSLRTVAFRFRYETSPPPPIQQRFKAAAYDSFDIDGWRRGNRQSLGVARDRDGYFHLAKGRTAGWIRIWLKSLGPRLVLPVETTVVDLPLNGVVVDEAGEAALLTPQPGTSEYRVGVMEKPVATRWGRRGQNLERSKLLDTKGVTPEMADLARMAMGPNGTLGERARRLERFLQSEYEYSSGSINDGERPVEQFLFSTKKGHCELFATSMALLLRSEGVETRLATGFFGADYNPLEQYFIVRQSNAHAWVEAFIPDEGWLVFDPTPASGRPQSGRSNWATLMTQAYDYMLFRWDRYVLTYGFSDQAGALFRFRDLWSSFWDSLKKKRDVRQASEAAPPSALDEPKEPRDEPERSGFSSVLSTWQALPLLFVLVASAGWFWFRRERFSATKAYRTLRQHAYRKHEVPLWIGPQKLEQDLIERCPQASSATRTVVSHYLRESFAESEPSKSELAEVREALGEVTKSLRKTA